MSKKRRAKKISKTEKKLRGQLKYIRSKISKANKEVLDLAKKYNYDYSAKVTNKTNLNTEIQKIIENKVLKSNKRENEILKKLERFKYKAKGKYEIANEEEYTRRVELGKAWERNEIDQQLFKLDLYNTIDSLSIKTKLPQILILLLRLIGLMDSNSLLVGYVKGKNIDLYIETE